VRDSAMKGGHPCTTTDHSHVLQLDIQGTPQAWISLEQAACTWPRARWPWVDGDGPLATLRGGFQRRARPPVGHRRAPDHRAARRVEGQPVRRGAGVQQATSCSGATA
jgi:hypothetical protein